HSSDHPAPESAAIPDSIALEPPDAAAVSDTVAGAYRIARRNRALRNAAYRFGWRCRHATCEHSSLLPSRPCPSTGFPAGAAPSGPEAHPAEAGPTFGSLES